MAAVAGVVRSCSNGIYEARVRGRPTLHGKAVSGGRVERQPTYPGEQDLHPGMGVVAAHGVPVSACRLAGDEAHGHAGGDAVQAKEERHGAREVLAVAFPGIEEKGRVR